MKKRARKRKPATRKTDPWTPLSPEEEEKKIIELLDAHVPQNEIAQVVRRNINYINSISQKRQQSLKPRGKSLASLAFKLFKEEDKSTLDVAIELGIDAPEAEDYRAQYWRLINLDDLYAVYKNLGPKLGEFVDTYNHFSSKGITVDQAIEIRNLSSKANELRSYFNSLTNEKARLSTEIPQMREERDQLTNQLGNLNSELNNRKATNEQLKQEYNGLNSVLNTIKQGELTFQKIKQIAKEEGKSIMISKLEQMLTSLGAAITVLKNNHSLIPLLLAPGPGLDDPRLRNEVLSLYTNAWNELANSVTEQTRNIVYDKVKQIVENLHRAGS